MSIPPLSKSNVQFGIDCSNNDIMSTLSFPFCVESWYCKNMLKGLGDGWNLWTPSIRWLVSLWPRPFWGKIQVVTVLGYGLQHGSPLMIYDKKWAGVTSFMSCLFRELAALHGAANTLYTIHCTLYTTLHHTTPTPHYTTLREATLHYTALRYATLR